MMQSAKYTDELKYKEFRMLEEVGVGWREVGAGVGEYHSKPLFKQKQKFQHPNAKMNIFQLCFRITPSSFISKFT